MAWDNMAKIIYRYRIRHRLTSVPSNCPFRADIVRQYYIIQQYQQIQWPSGLGVGLGSNPGKGSGLDSRRLQVRIHSQLEMPSAHLGNKFKAEDKCHCVWCCAGINDNNSLPFFKTQ